MDQISLLQQLINTVFTFDFFWIVLATIVSTEVLKRNILPSDLNARWYPIIALVLAMMFVLLKTAFTGDWREWIANFIFTVMLTDLLYTYIGQYIIKSILAALKKTMGLKQEVTEEINNKDNG